MLELKYKINKFDEIKKWYFDINNIFIINNNEYEKIYISLLKIYNYFNQLGDGFYRNILDYQNTQIKGVEEFNYLYNTHNFNILLWGENGSGKSTFINIIMGEKKNHIPNLVNQEELLEIVIISIRNILSKLLMFVDFLKTKEK